MVRYLFLIPILLLVGCSQKDVNSRIALQNQQSQQYMVKALSEAKTSEAVVAISILFAVGAGQQKFYRNDTVLDYINGLAPWLSMGLSAYGQHKSGSRSSQAMSAGRDIIFQSPDTDTSIGFSSGLLMQGDSNDGWSYSPQP